MTDRKLQYFDGGLRMGYRSIEMAERLVKGQDHRVDRLLGFFSSRPNWDHPLSHPQASVSPPLWFLGEAYSLGGEGVWGSQFGRGDRHCRTLSINELCNQTEYKGKYIHCSNQMDVRAQEPDAIGKILRWRMKDGTAATR
jgi:hypothetical protein